MLRIGPCTVAKWGVILRANCITVSIMMDTDDGWRGRLEQAIKDSGRSARSISLAMGRSRGYIHAVLNTKNQPKLEYLVAICDEMQISVLWLLYGIDMDKDAETLLRIYSSLNAEQRKQFVALAAR